VVSCRPRRQVVGAARDLTKAKAAAAQVRKDTASKGGGFELVQLDLASLKSVRACAEGLLAKGEPFDAVIANAGVMAPSFGTTGDGFEMNRVAPLLRAGGRVVNLSSAGHRCDTKEDS
jgi:NAD(P)-dependent dehydrogenase (short-subunit alcohol dehydrogenase family)